MNGRDGVSDQLINFKKTSGQIPGRLTTKSGNPIGNKSALLSVGERGPVLLQDVNFLDEISSFTRERIPERVVHAKGAGATGYFEVTHDIKKYTAAKLFDTIGKKTPVAIRFSTVAGESGSADTLRDPRGFAVKFYTEDGIWDMVGNNIPTFFIRDAHLFPSFIHTQKRNPTTHCKDPDMFWDFMTLRTETTHQVLLTFADRGIPDGYRFMNGYGSHTFKFVNSKGVSTFVKFHFKTEQGIKNLPVEKAAELASTDPDYAIRDLFNAISKGNYPAWKLNIQVMTEEQAENLKFNPFDMTKVWPQGDFPLIPVGRLVLDKNPSNYFTDVEQIAFNPAHLVPGIEPSPDKMLQGRLLAYKDTHLHRLGANHLQLPINCPYRNTPMNYQRDGPQAVNDNQKGAPNYFPNSFGGPEEDALANSLTPKWYVTGAVGRYQESTDDDFVQSGVFYRKVLNEEERQRLAQNLSDHLKDAAGFFQDRAIKKFTKVDPDLGKKIIDLLAPFKRYHSNI